MANINCCCWINTSGELETQLCKITEQATWLKKVTPSEGSFFDFDWSGSWGLQTLGIILLIIIFLVHCIFSKALNMCSQPLTIKQMTFPRLECQKRNEQND